MPVQQNSKIEKTSKSVDLGGFLDTSSSLDSALQVQKSDSQPLDDLQVKEFSNWEILDSEIAELGHNPDLILRLIFEKTKNYRDINKNGAFPYRQYNLLRTLLQLTNPGQKKKVLELGTALGLTAIAMTLDSELLSVDSVDRNPENLIIAQKNLETLNLEKRVFLHNKDFLDFLDDVPKSSYDLIFFDGFSARISLFLEMEARLKSGGIMVCANLWSLDKNKPYHRMQNTDYYRNFFFFEDTGIGIKK